MANRGEERWSGSLRKFSIPGYCEMKSHTMIPKIVMTHFSGELRERAPRDPLIRARMPVTFVQYVIIPELAAELIMEDMQLGWDEALEVMEESRELGVALFPNADDRVAN